MGAMLFWLGVGLVITLVLLAAWAVDRRARRTGHQVREGGDILSEAWEHGRDVDLSGNAFYLGQDLSWTSRSRHTKAATEGGPSAGTGWAASVPPGQDGTLKASTTRGQRQPAHGDPGPLQVRTAPGTAGPRWARTVTLGEQRSQVTGVPPP